MNETVYPSKTNADPLNLIDKIFYINLTSRLDRHAHFIGEMRKHNIPQEKFERFDAINGAEYIFSEAEFSLFKNANYLNMATRPQIMGNQMSHFKLFQLMIARNYKYMIICQDDITFKDNFTRYIDELTNNLPTDAEIVHFGFHKYAVRDIFLPWDLSNESRDEVSYENVNDVICKLKPTIYELYNCHNTTGYILTLNGAKNYVAHALKNGFEYGTDAEISSYLFRKDIFYGSRRVLATTVPTFGSDVFANIHNTKDDPNNPYKLNSNNSFLNYLNIYNWTNDLPRNINAKVTFVSMLANFVACTECEILEVGTFAGTSVIGMLQYLPCARATTIDNWANYDDLSGSNVENVFFENINAAVERSRITPLKGDSGIVLKYLIQQKKLYKFIYIDGSREPAIRYADCLLSWELLETNGIMAINAYITNEQDNDAKCVNDFLDEIIGQYIVLETGYRLFIKKL
jgi:GR25 family glycosyltransferase involved in LPS biosynthesis/predicted O-methyltransferase YrrM